MRSVPFLCAFAASVAAGQRPTTIAGDRARLAELVGAPVNDTVSQARFRLRWPDVRIVYNSAIPYSLNDGPLWAGRGTSVAASGGASIGARILGVRLDLRVEPMLLFSQNRLFDFLPATIPGRSAFSSPFHGPETSIDLPMRFGDRALVRIDPGLSEFSLKWRAVAVRLTAANDWWGPSLRNALVMSDNAPGIPRVEIATAHPVRTRIGSFTAKVIAGALTESGFFDTLDYNNRRAISGAVFTLRPAFDTTLVFGLERVVYSRDGEGLRPLAHVADFATRWNFVDAFDTSGTRVRRSNDQITAVTARWVFPTAGLEVYGEWARSELPRSFSELLEAAHYSGAYTIGLQWAQPRRQRDYLRLQTEFSYLEQSLVFTNRSAPEYYSSVSAPQGYTQRGQIVGAAIGPGASSQWIALDYIAPRWQTGAFVGRIRWENDALYRQFAPNFFRHDVTLLGGIRSAWRAPLWDVSFDVTLGHRFNYLFQNGQANPGGFRTVDIHNLTVSLAATPR